MVRKKNKQLKGFTLIELIVVIATFGIILAAVLSMIQPVTNIFKKTERFASAEAVSDNTRRVIEDRLRYANRMLVTVGHKEEVSEAAEQAYITEKVEKLRKEFMFGDPKRLSYYQDKVYVLKIDNPEKFTDIPSDQNCGRIRLWVYEKDNKTPTGESKEWVIDKGLYNEYGFSLSAGINYNYETKTVAGRPYYPIVEKQLDESKPLGYADMAGIVSSPSNFCFELDIYEKYTDIRVPEKKGTYTLCRTDAKNKVTNKVAVALTNIVSEATYKEEKITYLDAESKEVTKDVRRYMSPEIEYDTKDIYFFYTMPDFSLS